MKKFISIFLSLLLIFTFSTQAFASVGDDDPTEQSGIEDSFAIPPSFLAVADQVATA